MLRPSHPPPELTAAIENATRDVFNRHGLSAFAMSREAAIAHEVGHAIVMTHEELVIQSESVVVFATLIFTVSAYAQSLDDQARCAAQAKKAFNEWEAEFQSDQRVNCSQRCPPITKAISTRS